MSKSLRLHLLCGWLAVAGLAGCATDAEKEFGSSVRHMIAGQKDDPSPASTQRSALDGAKAANAVEAYRAPAVEPGQRGEAPHGGGQRSVPAARESTQ